MIALSFTVPGQPVPKARPRVYRKRTIADPRTALYECRVRVYAQRAVRHLNRVAAWSLEDAAYAVTLRFWTADARRRDADNLAKSVLDACNGVVWRDDSAVSELHVFREIDRRNPRCEIEVTPRRRTA